MCKIIEKKNLNDFQRVHVDGVGNIYEYEGKIIRLINKNATLSTKRLLSSGCIEELVREHLLIDTWVSEYTTEDDLLVLEHRKIPVKQHYSQWSFEMMREAALTVLKANKICNKYGYELKDCHQANIMFDSTVPVWVDFGSIVRKQEKTEWIARNDFLKCYYYPLLLASRGYTGMTRALYKASIPCNCDEMESLLYNIPLSMIKNVRNILNKSRDEDWLCKKISGLHFKSVTMWGDYQDRYWDTVNVRFQYEIDWIKSVSDIHSMVEVGANQGAFSYHCAKETNLANIIATDYDYGAVDKMYVHFKERGIKNITPLILDFVWASDDELKNKCADLVVANALTHHLLLTQGMTREEMVNRFLLLTGRYLIVEFIPRGVNKHKTPKWYTLDWFLEGIRKEFNILKIKEFNNRIIIIGEKLARV